MTGDRDRSEYSRLPARPGMAMKIFVDEILCRDFAESSEPLRTPRSHPDEVASGDGIPGVAEAIDSAALEHDEAVLHHVHLDHAERRSRLVDHGVHREVVARLVG